MSSVRRLGMGLALFVGLAFLSTTVQASVEIFDGSGNQVFTSPGVAATSVSMTNLLGGYTIQVDDKLFSGFDSYH